MENFYNGVVTLTNCAAYVPFSFAHAHGKRHDWMMIGAAALCSLLYHGSLAVAPQYSTDLLWADRAAAVATMMHFLYRFASTCPYDAEKGYHATRVMACLGLLCLFIADVLLAMQPTMAWCVLHGVWHICAFFCVRKVQNFIYRAEGK